MFIQIKNATEDETSRKVLNLAHVEVTELKDTIIKLQQERELLSAKVLIQSQINCDKNNEKKENRDLLLEEIDELKEALDRKEYLLQFNEQKYHQYELMLRDLILHENTP